jgi:exopolysaccharide biosynthesis protein
MKRFAVFFLVPALLGAGCVSSSPQATPSPSSAVVAPINNLPVYAERRVVNLSETGERVTFLMLRIEPDAWQWSLAQDPGNLKTPEAWRAQLGAEIVMNGSYFNERGEPSGYFRNPPDVPSSSIRWPLDAQNRTGYTGAVLLKDGALSLAYLPDADLDPAQADAIFLTFPTLVANGKSVVEKESGLRARRTALAEDADGRDYILVTEEGSVSLFALSRWLVAQPEEFRIAVNLDGGPSTGLALRDGDAAIDLGLAPVPNVLALRKRK